MATILAHVKVKPGSEARWEEVVSDVWRDTHANESAVRRYEYWRGAEPGRYYVLLSFDDYHGFLAHQVADYHENAPFGELTDDIRLEWVDPVVGASGLAATAMQDAPADASELARQYAANMPADVQDWWLDLRD